MKFVPKLITASAASLLLASASQAALIGVNIGVDGTITGATTGTITGAFTGTYDTDTGQILASGASTNVTAYTNATIGSDIALIGVVGLQTNTSCLDNGGIIDLCVGSTVYGVDPINATIGIPLPMDLTSNTVDGTGNGAFTTFTAAAANVSITYTVTAVPLPAAAWLFGSALLGLTGVARRRKT